VDLDLTVVAIIVIMVVSEGGPEVANWHGPHGQRVTTLSHQLRLFMGVYPRSQILIDDLSAVCPRKFNRRVGKLTDGSMDFPTIVHYRPATISYNMS
jgi:hypothetical protein